MWSLFDMSFEVFSGMISACIFLGKQLLMLELEELELLLLLKQRAGCKGKDDDELAAIKPYHPLPKPPSISGILTSKTW